MWFLTDDRDDQYLLRFWQSAIYTINLDQSLPLIRSVASLDIINRFYVLKKKKHDKILEIAYIKQWNMKGNSTYTLSTCMCKIVKYDAHQNMYLNVKSIKFRQNEKSPLISNYLTQKLTQKNRVWNPGLGQPQKCGGIKPVNRVPILHLLIIGPPTAILI